MKKRSSRESQEVVIRINGVKKYKTIANEPRPGLKRKGIGSGNYGFSIKFEPKLNEGDLVEIESIEGMPFEKSPIGV